MTIHKITIVKDFHPRPYGRDINDDPTNEATGERFRDEFLAPALREYDKVHVILDGYNRYGPSFLDEAFAGLIRTSGFSPDEIKRKLSYSHSALPTIEEVIKRRIEKATRDYNSKL